MANPAADYPGAIHTKIDTSSYDDQYLGATTPKHTDVHGKLEEEIAATQLKLGTGSSTPVSGQALMGSADGVTAWRALSKSDVGLSNVDNTSDANKPISTATQSALDLKLDSSAVSAFGATLIDDANAATARTTLGLIAGGSGDIWVEKAGDSMSGALTIGLNSAVLNLGDNTNSTVYSNIQGTRSYVGYDANGYAVLQGGASKGLRLNVNNATFGVGTAVEIDTAGQFKMAGATSSSTGILLGGDVNLYRSAADVLSTDDNMVITGTAAGSFALNISPTNQTTSAYGLLFGTDTNLYRSTSNTLATDDSMQVLGTSLYAQGNLTVGPGNTSVGISVRASSFNGFTFDIYSDTASAYSFFRRTRGSLASPTIVTSGSFLGSIGYRGYADAGMPVQDAARISGYATQDFTTTMGASIGFYTAANGTLVSSGATERMTVHHSGNVGIGNTAPTYKLQLAAATTDVGGIGFGTDTNLYRQAANQLATDDRFYGLGGISTGANDQTSNLYIGDGSGKTDTTTASLQVGGAATTSTRATQRGSSLTVTANAAYASWVLGQNAITEAGTGTHPLLTQLGVRILNTTNAGGATTNAATVWIEGAQSGITPTGKNLSLWVEAGDSEFGGDVDAASFSVAGTSGASGTFTTADAKTVTVTNGLITSIV